MISTLRASAALALLAVPVQAQVIAGAVMDTGGSPVADAIVRVQATNISTTTAIDGSYTLLGVTGTNITVVAAKKGYFNEDEYEASKRA